MINKLVVVGNIASDPKVLGSNGTFMGFSIAVNEQYQDQNKQWQSRVHFFNVTRSHGKNGIDYLMKNLRKGMKVIIEGELSQNRYKVGNESRSDVQIKATGIDFYFPEQKANNSGGSNYQQNNNQGQGQNYQNGGQYQQNQQQYQQNEQQDQTYYNNPPMDHEMPPAEQAFNGEFDERSFYDEPPASPGEEVPTDNY